MKRSHGFRVSSRKKLTKRRRYRGMPPVTHFLRTFDMDEKVVIKIEPSSHKGMPHPRFYGRIGRIVGKQGRVYKVEIKDGKKKKILLCAPEHLESFE